MSGLAFFRCGPLEFGLHCTCSGKNHSVPERPKLHRTLLNTSSPPSALQVSQRSSATLVVDPRELAVVPDPELEACFAMADAGALSCGCFAGNCACAQAKRKGRSELLKRPKTH